MTTATGDSRLTTGDCDILQRLTSSAESNVGMARLYALVVICEIAVVGGLWLLGRIYS